MLDLRTVLFLLELVPALRYCTLLWHIINRTVGCGLRIGDWAVVKLKVDVYIIPGDGPRAMRFGVLMLSTYIWSTLTYH